MVRKKALCSRKGQPLIKYVVLGTLIVCICVLGSQFNSVGLLPVFASTSPDRLRSNAQSLTVKGHQELAVGNAESALENWKKATEAYIQLDDTEGIAGSQINQSLALQALGQYRRACRILLTAIKLDYQDNLACKQPNETDIKSKQQSDFLKEALGKLDNYDKFQVLTIGLRNLGDVLRVIGNLENSELVLKKSLEMAKNSNFFPEVNAGLLSYGNTKRAWYKRYRNLYERTEWSNNLMNAIESAEESLKLDREVSDDATATKLQSKLNRLSLLVELADWLDHNQRNPIIKDKLVQIQSQIQPQINEIINSSSLFSNLPPIQSIYAKLNLAISLEKLKPKDRLVIAIQYAKEALHQAQDLPNQRAEAYAYGVLGKLYKNEQINQLSLAQSWTEKAVNLSQSIQANDLAYQWKYQLGNIYEKNQRVPDAIAAYNDAVNILEIVRQDLLSINRDLQFSFQEDVKPIYDDLIDLLLRSQPKQDALKKVTEVIGKLQIAELQNFLQCGSLGLIPIDEVNDRPDAAFYTIVLEGQKKIEVIVSVYNKQSKLHQYHHYSVDWNELQKTVNILQNTLQDRNLIKTPDTDILSSSQKLYQLLIAPAKSYLPKTGDLVFILDSQLQSIPMAILQDEDQHYLVENHSITLSLGVRSLEPKKLHWEHLRVLIAGVSQGPSFKKESEELSDFRELPNIQFELDEVEKNTIKSEILYNEDFTKARFQDRVNASKFLVLHIATHGIFNSDPEQTVILAYDTRINIRELDSLFRSRSESSSDPLELLVLSACQTARGDKRAGLGIAGVAVQAGARSTLASLWNVDDKSTALFMGEFYRGLKAGLTKAEALRKAQLAFLKNPDRKENYKNYAHPYYWVPFILVGSWL